MNAERAHEGYVTLFKALVLLLLPLLLLALNSGKLHAPTAQWDGWGLRSVLDIRAGVFASRPYLVHPPLYLYLLAFFQPLFPGGLLEGARLFNCVCYLATGWFVYLTAVRLAGKNTPEFSGLAAAALYYLSPLALQGVFLLDLGDTSLVPLAASVYFWLITGGQDGFFPALAAAVSFAVNLWAKFIHSVFIMLAGGLECVSGGCDSDALKAVKPILAGVGLFLVSWAVYAFYSLAPDDRWKPFEYLLREIFLNYQRQDFSMKFSELARQRLHAAVRITLWLWPLGLLWFCGLKRYGFGRGSERKLNYMIAIFLVAAWISKGTSNGFPKYHAAVLPAMCALAGRCLPAALAGLPFHVVRLAGAAGLAVFCAILLLGDPILTFNYSLKAAAICGSGTGQALSLLALQAAAVPAAVVALYFLFRGSSPWKRAVFLSSFTVILAWEAAIGCLQARAAYFTHYGYGTTGKDGAVAYVLSGPPGAKVLGPNEFAWEFSGSGARFKEVSDTCQAAAACIPGLLRDPAVKFFIFGQASNTIAEVRYFLSFDEKKIGRPFIRVKKGDFWIYDFGGEETGGERRRGRAALEKRP